ncbi:MAG TPA: hypothetical protein VKM55_15190 [Candidatus Lokiarchaeia archaeon]|nr:hypothetical protein [Candidatus Lokiarchaeia archaeon]
MKSKQKIFMHLVFLFSISIANQGAELLTNIARVADIAKATFVASQVLEIIALILLLVILETFEENKAVSIRIAGFLAIGAMIIGSMIGGSNLIANPTQTPIGTGYIVQFQHKTFTEVLLVGFAGLTFVWLVITYIKKRKTTRNVRQRSLVTWLFIGIFLSQVVGSLGSGVLDPTNRVSGQFWEGVSIIKTIGIIIVGIAFYRVGKTPWLLQLQKTHLLLVYSKSGLPLYSKIFREDIAEHDIELLAGAITAVTALFKESTKETNPLESIRFKGKVVRIIDRGTFVCAVMVDYTSQASDSAQDNFANEFGTRYAVDLLSFNGNVSKFDTADDIAQKYFT